MAYFDQKIQNGPQHMEVQMSKVEYFGRIQGIFEIDYRTFQVYILDVQLVRAITHGRNPTLQRDASGFVAIDSTKLWTDRSDTFVLVESCEQVYVLTLYHKHCV